MKEELICSSLALVVYIGTIHHQFVYDDRKAVLSNPSVVGRNSISAFTSDYWGVPLSHPGSHKSYRPLTTLSFRLDWILNPAPTQFHLTNLLLHAVATLLYVKFCKLWVSPETGLIAGLIFAVHPVHTEAVAGVVGRADVLSCILFLSCLIIHTKDGFSWKTSLLALLSMLAKEQGVTVLIVCAVIDLLSSQGVHQVRKSFVKLFLTFISLLCLRSIALDGNLPSFSKSDNPASHCESIQTRTLTFLLLPALNFQLLFLPSTLSYDWSMESIPLVSSILDIRNIISTVFYSLLLSFISRVVFNFYPRIVGILKKIGSNPGESSCLSKTGEESRRKIDTIQVMALSLSLLILPFLPATNLFFYVGFVLAERVLYIPSLGYCLLLAISLENLSRFNRRWVRLGTLIMLGFFTLKTLSRNQDWTNEESLFSSGISINPAKSWSNYGNILDGAGNQAGAELAFKQALIHRSNMADTHYNLGTLLQNQGRIQESILCYEAAIRFRPKLGVAYLNLGVALSDLGRKSEAMNILEKCSKVDDNGLKDPKENVNARISSMFHLGKLLLESKDIKGAISVLERAVNQSRRETGNPNLEKIFNLLGECYQETGNHLEAEHWYSQSLITNPKHIPAHLTLAKMLAKNVSREQDAESWFLRARDISPSNPAVYAHYGLFLLDKQRFTEAVSNFVLATQYQPGVYDYTFNLAVAARLAGQLDLSEASYRAAVQLKPGDAEPHLNLGALLHLRGRLEAAEDEYITAWRIKPGDETTKINLQRLHSIMRKKNIRVNEIGV